jgi:hypothetical protein
VQQSHPNYSARMSLKSFLPRTGEGTNRFL